MERRGVMSQFPQDENHTHHEDRHGKNNCCRSVLMVEFYRCSETLPGPNDSVLYIRYL